MGAKLKLSIQTSNNSNFYKPNSNHLLNGNVSGNKGSC